MFFTFERTNRAVLTEKNEVGMCELVILEADDSVEAFKLLTKFDHHLNGICASRHFHMIGSTDIPTVGGVPLPEVCANPDHRTRCYIHYKNDTIEEVIFPAEV